jgi:hypothetical protein
VSQEVLGGRLHVDVDSETTGFGRELQGKIDAETRNVRARIRAELDARGLREEARRAATEASREKVTFQADFDSRDVRAKARAAALEASRDARVALRAELDDASWAKAGAEIASLTGDRAVHIQVHADTARAKAEIEKLRAEARANAINVPVSAGGGAAGAGGGAAGTISKIADQLMGGGKIAALVGGIYALGVAAVQAGMGLFAMASAASQAVVTLAALPNAIGLVVQAGLGLFAAFSGLGGGIQALMKQQQGLGKAAQSTARQEQSSARAIAAAQHQVSQARQQAADDAHQAAESVADGEWAVSRAQKAAHDAQVNLNQAREQARADIKALRVELERSTLDEKEAANALAKAKQHLQDVRWDKSSTSQDRKDARLAVEDAQQQYNDAKKHRSDTKKQYDQAAKDGVKNSQVVKQAQDQLLVSNHDLMIAERNLADTRHRNAEQAANDAYSIQQAQQALADAQKQATDNTKQQTLANQSLLYAYNQLSPAGQRFAKFVVNTLLPRLKEIRADAQAALLPPLQEGITRALPLLDTIDKGLVATDKILGRMFISVGTLFGSKGFNRDVGRIMGSNNKAIRILTGAVKPLIKMFTDLAVVAGPHLLIPFVKWVAQVIRGWQESVHAARETGRLADKFDSARRMAALLWDILKNVVGAIHGMGKAATPAGTDLLHSLDKVVRKWDTWANSRDGQKQMRRLFESVKPLTKEVGRVLVDLLKLIGAMSKAGGGPTLGFLKALDGVARALTTILNLPVIGPAIGWLLTLAGAGGGLALTAGAVLKLWAGLKSFSKLTGLTKLWSLFEKSLIGTRIQVTLLQVQEKIAAAATAVWSGAMQLLGLSTKGAFIQFTVAVAIIAALVAGFVLAYKHIGWFRDLVNTVVGAVVGAFKWLWDVLFGHSIIPDMQKGFAVFGQVLSGIFGAIGGAIHVLGRVFSWLWQNAVKPAWSLIQKAIDLAWNYYYKPYLKLIRLELRILGAVFSWLWDHAVKPAFNGIMNIVQWAWKNVLKPDFVLIGKAVKVVGDVFTWLWQNAVKPAWNHLTDAIQWGWNHLIKPVFSALSDFVNDHVKPAFSKAVGGLQDIWNGLATAAQKPVNFLVNTLYNDGIRKVINLIPGVPDLDPLNVSFKFADGGVMPGYTPGRDIHRFVSPGSGMTLDLSGGEAIMRPEWTSLIGGPAVVRMLNSAARKGAGALRRLMGSLAGRGDIGVDGAGHAAFAKGGTIAESSLQNALTFAQQQVGKPYLWGSAGPDGFDCSGFMSAITNVILGYSNPYFRRGATSSFPWAGFRPGIGQFTIGSTPMYPGSSVGHMAGTLAVGGKGYNVESRGGHGPLVGPLARGYNDPGFRTIGHLGRNLASLGQSALPGAHGALPGIVGKIKSLITRLPGMLHDLTHLGGDWGKMLSGAVHNIGDKFRGWVNGKVWGPGPIPGNIFDSGGWLNPGLTLAYNGTGNPERIYTHEQMLGLSNSVSRLVDNSRTDNSRTAAPLVGSLALSVGSRDQVPEVFDDLDHELRILRLGGVGAHSTVD